ncbi:MULTISPECIES: glycerophosphoryl diester phosphodiesterase membrane domain-containing protein [Sphingomonas]|jgi:hypothetical protein|uniref:DUF7847 domain-containing protein n=1 Tax=Sphingomonas zeae TaxID=1646122 RepID=A0A7Y6EGX0_9SPHN|nr:MULTISPECIES: glycerophosphoryl diester phosphodiesterase membrane domain-containing protein [Sphingomonas]MBB4048186.1 hypothetical protein [Sphingomonas zeae]MDK8184735.1 glycerophosphoryl diester phosphodiesterase membrane domain-containing protein [Sphingomonas zeae]MDK8215456.1 glycerophosphoryl diester phosphodiesterase membrane domain-containing protein [Sphingomonas sp. UMB7805-LC452B]NUU46910.1 hypothetical protein [Sphingomonas zeae]
MTVRIGTVWDSTQQVLAGRAGMIAPFAAIGFVLPSVLQLVLAPPTPTQPQIGMMALGLTVLSALLGIWAQLAIMALATHPATTSADASRAGLRRLGPVLGVALAIGMGFALVALVMIVVLGLSHFDFAAAVAANGDPSKMPPISGGASLFLLLYGLAILAGSLWLVARLMLTYAVVLNERRGLGAIRRSIALTRGLTWRLIGTFLLFGIVMLVATLAAQSVTGAAFRLALGADHAVTAARLAALLGSIVSAGFLTLGYVFIARLYVATAGDQAHHEEVGSRSL